MSGVHVSTEGHEEGCHQALPTWWWCGGGRVGSCSLLPEARSGVRELCVLEADQVTAQTLAPSNPSESPAHPGPGSASLDQVEWRYDRIQQVFHKPGCYPELGDEGGNTLNPT